MLYRCHILGQHPTDDEANRPKKQAEKKAFQS